MFIQIHMLKMNAMKTIYVDKRDLLLHLRRRTVRNFMDFLILSMLRKGALSGYDIITIIFENFGFLPSSGSVYSTLYALEREGFVRGLWCGKRRLYTLTEEGEKIIEAASASLNMIENLILNIFKGGD